ncbi:hypothetical protein Sjap_008913 [Stephania japonica]|uniref:Uncharacterized protein n=1 Tax=Stephania japonica TaxID=461633 RepID=A0AAP0JR70_9MAGN
MNCDSNIVVGGYYLASSHKPRTSISLFGIFSARPSNEVYLILYKCGCTFY